LECIELLHIPRPTAGILAPVFRVK
jgi:hypothetical protein